MYLFIAAEMRGFDYINSSPLNKMAAILQTVFSDAFSLMTDFINWLKFHWCLFVRVCLKITSISLDNVLASNRRQTIIWTYVDPSHCPLYVALGGDQLIVSYHFFLHLIDLQAVILVISAKDISESHLYPGISKIILLQYESHSDKSFMYQWYCKVTGTDRLSCHTWQFHVNIKYDIKFSITKMSNIIGPKWIS